MYVNLYHPHITPFVTEIKWELEVRKLDPSIRSDFSVSLKKCILDFEKSTPD